MVKFSSAGVIACCWLALTSMAPTQAATDADAARALFKKNDCAKCHAADKTKKGPSLKKIAAKLRAENQDKVIKNITTAPKVKLDDGSEEDHKVVGTKDPKELRNLADWILAQ